VERFFQPYVYLNRETIAAHGLDMAEVSRQVAEELRKFPGVAYAVSSHDLRAGRVARTPVTDAVLANFHEDRSGDIYVVFEPHWFVADFDGQSVPPAGWPARCWRPIANPKRRNRSSSNWACAG